MAVRATLQAQLEQGIDALGGSPAEFKTFVDHELKQWADVVQTAGIAKKR